LLKDSITAEKGKSKSEEGKRERRKGRRERLADEDIV